MLRPLYRSEDFANFYRGRYPDRIKWAVTVGAAAHFVETGIKPTRCIVSPASMADMRSKMPTDHRGQGIRFDGIQVVEDASITDDESYQFTD